MSVVCGVASESGTHGEPLACGYPKGHAGPHAWASLPTFVAGRPVFEGRDHPLASIDAQLTITDSMRPGPGRWRWEVCDLRSGRRITEFGHESTERKAWVKALAVARASFGPTRPR